MTRYIIRRLIHSIFIIWGVATLVFFGLRAIPGDPIIQILGEEYTPENAEALEKKLGLDRPIYIQYVRWMGDTMTGDFGESLTSNESVIDAIKTGLPKTASITLLSFSFALIIALPAGIIAALRRNTWLDYVSSLIAFFGVAMPAFWFGIILILIFAVRFNWLPAIGYSSLDEGFWPWLSHLILPSVAVGTGLAAILMRFIRTGLLEVLGSDYVRTARSKGLAERNVVIRHALRNSLIPIVTIIGIQLALLINGTVVIEIVFSIRGMGRILVGAIFDKNYPVAQGIILFTSVTFVMANLIVDIVYTWLDPRIRYD
jgi:peptide/nickel transport system permease protein